MGHVSVICITPILNEAWILDRFLKCASLWADHIIIADQNSTDGSREIASKYAKVILVDDPHPSDEGKRQESLIEAARKLPAPRLLLAMHADEIFSSNFDTSPEWATMQNVEPGTTIWFKWANLDPDMRTYWSSTGYFGFMDDETTYSGRITHSDRLPSPAGRTSLIMRDTVIMHLQYTDWQRMESKHRWYQCLERVNNPRRSAVSIFRQYHHMYAVRPEDRRMIPRDWIEGYREKGLDVTSTSREPEYFWERLILDLIEQRGASYLAKEYIWDVDWREIATRYGRTEIERYRDPRTAFQRLLHLWLRRTKHIPRENKVRFVDWMLREFGM